jgi:hypothetical protein
MKSVKPYRSEYCRYALFLKGGSRGPVASPLKIGRVNLGFILQSFLYYKKSFLNSKVCIFIALTRPIPHLC